MSEQLTGREDRPATGQDLYNFALKVDTNFAPLKKDMATGFAINSQECTKMRSEMLSEFKSVRAEMKTGFDNVAHQFDNVDHRFNSLAYQFDNSRAEFKLEQSYFKLWLVTRVAIISVVGGLSVVSGLAIAILLKM